MSQLKKLLPALLGFALVLTYFLWMRPAYNRLGWAEDLGGIEANRAVMADALRTYGHPHFFADRFMAPTGITATFFSWAIERDWIGGYLFNWNRDFPWLWVYFGISLAITYLGVGVILRKMKLSPPSAWGLATLVTLFNLPRQYQAYHHYEHLIQHWMVIAFFLDAWIWQRFVNERKISLNLELWRALLALAIMNLSGYYWGPMILEWVTVRGAMLRYRKDAEIEWDPRKAIPPLALGLVLFVIDLAWFLPLFHEFRKTGDAPQWLGFAAAASLPFRPLWLERIGQPLVRSLGLTPITSPETVVTIGWIYWVPVLLGIGLLFREQRKKALLPVLPFFIFAVMAVLFVQGTTPYFFYSWIKHLIPFMKYFRVKSRMGLFLVPSFSVMIALLWPVLIKFAKSAWQWRPAYRGGLVVFAVLSVLELPAILVPPIEMAAPSREMTAVLDFIRQSPGTTVLNLPFCVAGGNGICTDQECPQYPDSAAPGFLTSWHDKKVYGAYLGRMLRKDCEIYNRPPFTTWFSAWKQDRCFTDLDWNDFCAYLSIHPELSNIVLFPGIWKASQRPECQAKFRDHLGAPIKEASLYTRFLRGAPGENLTTVQVYAPMCLTNKTASSEGLFPSGRQGSH